MKTIFKKILKKIIPIIVQYIIEYLNDYCDGKKVICFSKKKNNVANN